MLVLSRKKNEKIDILGGEIKITVVEIRGDKVRLGIEADKSISVHRHEVTERIEQSLSLTNGN
jgi:carbon storage regulator